MPQTRRPTALRRRFVNLGRVVIADDLDVTSESVQRVVEVVIGFKAGAG
jgi:hypothetical protein